MDLVKMEGALRLYSMKAGFPTQDQGLQALVEKPSVEPIPGRWPATIRIPRERQLEIPTGGVSFSEESS